MIAFLTDLIGGWRQVRVSQGFSYQVNRTGQRRVLPVENYGRRGTIDEQWLQTGVFADERAHERFRDYNLRRRVRRAVKLQTA